MVSTPRFQGPSLSISPGNWLLPKSTCLVIYLQVIAGGETRGLVGRFRYLLCPVLPFAFINMLVIGDQAWHIMKPQSLLTLFLFRCISVASLTRQSVYPDVMSNIEVPVKLIQWPGLELFSTTLDFSDWCRLMYIWCFLHLALVVLHTFNIWSRGTFCSWDKTSTRKVKCLTFQVDQYVTETELLCSFPGPWKSKMQVT